MPFVDTATVIIYFNTGVQHEDDNTSGYTHFIEHLFLNANKDLKYKELMRTLDDLGCDIECTTYKNYVTIQIDALSENINQIIGIIFRALEEPKYSKSIDTERNVILDEIKYRLDSPEIILQTLVFGKTFEGMPLARYIGGNEKSIRSATKTSLLQHYMKYFTASNIIISIAGKYEIDKIKRMISSVNILKGARNSRDTTNTVSFKKDYVFHPSEQVYFAIVWKAYPIWNKNADKMNLVNMYLAHGASSVLFQKVRDKGFCYSINCYSNAYHETGILTIEGETSRKNLLKTFHSIHSVLETLKNDGIPSDRLKVIKNIYRTILARNKLSTAEIASFNISNYNSYGRILSFDEFSAMLNYVSANEVDEIIHDVFSGGNGIYVVGGKGISRLMKGI